MALFDEVYNYIENNYKANEPIFLSELNISGIKAVSVRQQMKKLTEDGRLKRFDTGIYWHYPAVCFMHSLAGHHIRKQRRWTIKTF